MEFTNEFTVPVSIDRAFAVLTDLETVAPCMPGATLDSVEDDTYQGHIKVKVGPMSLTYHGTARLVNVNEAAHSAGIEARGSDQRGGGTADADVTATMESLGANETKVIVTTDINVTGRPAQFGRGVMADVGAKIIDKFSDCLVGELSNQRAGEVGDTGGDSDDEPGPADDGAGPTLTVAGPTAASPAPPKRTFNPPQQDELDLLEVAGQATIKRLAPVLAALLVLLVVWRRRANTDE